MNPTFLAWLPAIITLIGWIFVAGRTSGRIDDQDKTLVTHDKWLMEHDANISALQIAQAKSEAFQEGFRAGSHYSEKKQHRNPSEN